MTASEDPANTSGAEAACHDSSDSGNSTPTRPSTLKTLPSFKDPRSPPHDPTDSRTPIQVEATPGELSFLMTRIAVLWMYDEW